MPWTTGGPGQPPHVPGKGYPQLAATAPMGQGIRLAETPKTPRGKFWIDSNQKKNVTFLLMVKRKKKVQTSYVKVVSLVVRKLCVLSFSLFDNCLLLTKNQTVSL